MFRLHGTQKWSAVLVVRATLRPGICDGHDVGFVIYVQCKASFSSRAHHDFSKRASLRLGHHNFGDEREHFIVVVLSKLVIIFSIIGRTAFGRAVGEGRTICWVQQWKRSRRDLRFAKQTKYAFPTCSE